MRLELEKVMIELQFWIVMAFEELDTDMMKGTILVMNGRDAIGYDRLEQDRTLSQYAV